MTGHAFDTKASPRDTICTCSRIEEVSQILRFEGCLNFMYVISIVTMLGNIQIRSHSDGDFALL